MTKVTLEKLKEAVTVAEANVPALKAAATLAAAAVKEGNVGLKAAKAALKNVPADTAEADQTEVRAAAEATVAQWEAHVVTTKTANDVAKEASKGAKAVVTEAKKAVRGFGKAERDAAAAEKKAARDNRLTQNDVLHPLKGSKCGDAWQVFDDVTAVLERPTKMAEALALGTARGLNEGNIKAEYNLWRKFHGVEKPGRATDADLGELAGKFLDENGNDIVPAYAEAGARSVAAAEKAKADEAEKARLAEEKKAKAAQDKADKEAKSAQDTAAKAAADKAAADAAQ